MGSSERGGSALCSPPLPAACCSRGSSQGGGCGAAPRGGGLPLRHPPEPPPQDPPLGLGGTAAGQAETGPGGPRLPHAQGEGQGAGAGPQPQDPQIPRGEDALRHLAGAAHQEVHPPAERVGRRRAGPQPRRRGAGGAEAAHLRHHQRAGGHPAHPQEVQEQHPVDGDGDLRGRGGGGQAAGAARGAGRAGQGGAGAGAAPAGLRPAAPAADGPRGQPEAGVRHLPGPLHHQQLPGADGDRREGSPRDEAGGAGLQRGQPAALPEEHQRPHRGVPVPGGDRGGQPHQAARRPLRRHSPPAGQQHPPLPTKQPRAPQHVPAAPPRAPCPILVPVPAPLQPGGARLPAGGGDGAAGLPPAPPAADGGPAALRPLLPGLGPLCHLLAPPGAGRLPLGAGGRQGRQRPLRGVRPGGAAEELSLCSPMPPPLPAVPPPPCLSPRWVGWTAQRPGWLCLGRWLSPGGVWGCQGRCSPPSPPHLEGCWQTWGGFWVHGTGSGAPQPPGQHRNPCPEGALLCVGSRFGVAFWGRSGCSPVRLVLRGGGRLFGWCRARHGAALLGYELMDGTPPRWCFPLPSS